MCMPSVSCRLKEGFGAVCVQREGALRLEALGTLISGDGLPPYLPLSSFLGISLRCHGELFGQLYLLEKVTSEGIVTAFTDLDEQILLTL